jgi:excisionase family DNA binding protein
MTSELLSITEAAQVLGLTRQGVHWLITQGRLPARRIGGRWLLAAATVYAEKEARK